MVQEHGLRAQLGHVLLRLTGKNRNESSLTRIYYENCLQALIMRLQEVH